MIMAGSLIPPLQPLQYEELLRRALAEDLGRGGDLTTDAIVPVGEVVSARIVSRAAGVVSGCAPAAATFELLDGAIEIEQIAADGCRVADGDVLLVLRGCARTVLSGERTALNILGRLSGVATLTRRFVDAVAQTRARIVCTRKTTPGMRVLEKYAVRCGGGWNHRFALDDAVLIKDNHLAAAGGVRSAIEAVRRSVGHTVTVEVEVDSLDQLSQALDVEIDVVLLDNMTTEELRRAVAMVDGRAVTEASGGITLENVSEIAATGVDLISVGAITHSAPSLDVSLELDPIG
jgi:nicotinate-nucleotide pyrophosphorylase (carboxylating)